MKSDSPDRIWDSFSGSFASWPIRLLKTDSERAVAGTTVRRVCSSHLIGNRRLLHLLQHLIEIETSRFGARRKFFESLKELRHSRLRR